MRRVGRTLGCATSFTRPYNLQAEDVMSIKASDLKKKTVKVKKSLDRRHDFRSRRYREADKSVVSGDYSKATQPLLKVNSRVNLEAIESAIKDSSPPRGYNELSQAQRQTLFTRAQSSNDERLLTVNDVLQQLKSSKKSRSMARLSSA